MDTVPRAGPQARMSIAHKLPLLFGSVLLVVILALTVSSVVEMRQAALRAASARSASLVQQFVALFQQSTAAARMQVAGVAAAPEVVRFAASGNARDRAAAEAALERAGAQQEQVVATELRDGSGATVIQRMNAGNANTVMPRLPYAMGDTVTLGSFARVGTSGAYPVSAPVPGALDVRIVQWRRIGASRVGRAGLKKLIGSDANLYLGNRDGSYITDLEREVTAVELNHAALRTPQVEERGDARRYLVSWLPIPRTPWVVGVEFPLEVILAPVYAFVRGIALLALGAFVAALFVVWLMSRRITGPLMQLVTAAEGMSSGDYAQKVAIQNSDELGQLGRSFNVMAAEVAQSRRGLEAMVEERTRTLNNTLARLHEAQQSLVRREKLAMLGQLASGIGQELHNRLSLMTIALDNLQTTLASAPLDVTDSLDILERQIALSDKVVNDLLDFARLKPPLRHPVSIADLAREQVSRLGPTAGVDICVDLPADLPNVLVDRAQVGQVLLNLLTNAVQAMEREGRITVHARANGGAVQLDVCDTGPGVSAQYEERIFEPLFTTKARGIGLGLAVSRTLARANEGDLTLQRTDARGASFRLTLPSAPAN